MLLAFRWYCLVVCLLACFASLTSGTRAFCQETDQEEQKQLAAIARFVTVLEKNPRRGTALDRVYGHHVEFGTLDTLVAELTARAANSSGEHWMIIGMIEYQRGNDAQAAEAFSKAESLRTKDPLASYYLGQAQIRIGDSSAAVASFERALERKPQRADELEIFQQLGRVHQRAQRTDEAMKVWKRLEELYPDDARVLEQIAVTLAEEGQTAEALPRYEKLAATSKDDYRKTTFAITAAELIVKKGDKPEGIRRMEGLLADLNPDGWLYRDVRRRIDDCFLRTGDQDGLVSYYQTWLESHPQDIEAMNRLARFLKQSARNPEAATWLNKALTLAPNRADIRKTYIDLLAEDKRFEDAAAQYEQLLKTSPNNADYLRDWGKMVLRNKEKPEADRRKQAFSIWNRMLEPNPNDAVMVAQVADFCRQNQMLEEAESLYRKAVDLAPSEPQYREYLGEFLSIQKRPDEAKAVWKEIAQGDRRNADNLARLAEIYNSFGYGEDACLNIAHAIELAPKDFALVLKGAEYHNKSARFDEAIKLVDQAEKLAANDEERESVLNTRIDVLQSSQRLEAIVEAMEKQLEADPASKANDWYRLARYQEAQRRWDDATATINKAIEKDPQSVLALTAAARIAESGGDFGRASELFRKLIQVDRRSISDYWTSVTRLETTLGRKDEALEAAKQLIVAAPSKTENYEFYAQTCFRLGETEEGMQALRKAIRINPNEPGLMMTLGTALADQMRTDEAIELYWRAYDTSEDITDKTSMVTKLVPLYSQTNQLDKLIERLERERQEEESRRGATICIAQAWQTAGDIAEARKELEALLGDDTKDTNLLNQLAKLCQSDADMDAAINYQRQLVRLAPGDETEAPLAGMLLKVGEIEEAKAIYAKLIEAEEDPVRQLRSLDSLLNSGNFDTALRVMEPLLDKQRDDWELLYRNALCWNNLKNQSEAKTRFDRILALAIPHETLGRLEQAKVKQAQEKAKSDNQRGVSTKAPTSQSAIQMTQESYTVRNAVGLDNQNYYSNTPNTLWVPRSYGLARMAALGWLLQMDQEAENSPAEDDASTESNDAPKTFADTIRDKATAAGASQRDLLDWLYVCVLKNDYPQIFTISRQLAQTGGIDEKRFFLQSLNTRDYSEYRGMNTNGNGEPTKTPMDDAALEFMQNCYDEVTAKQQSKDLKALFGANIAFGGNGQAYIMVGSNWQALPGVYRNSSYLQNLILEEYRAAGKMDRVNGLIQRQIEAASSADDWMDVLEVLREQKRSGEIPDTIEKWVAAAMKQIAETPVATNRSRGQSSPTMPLASAIDSLQKWIGQLGSEEENDRILRLLDAVLPVAVAEAKYRTKVAMLAKSTPASTANANRQANGLSIYTYYGETSNEVNIVFPPLSREVDTASVTLLRQVFDVLNKNEVSQDMVKYLRERLQTATDDSEYWSWYLASVLWWSEEQDDAMEIVTKIMAEYPSDPGMQFRWAALLESREDFEDALSVIDRISPRDQNQLIERETDALRLAERIGDIDRARQSAERLFGLRLRSESQLELLSQMKRLGMETQSDALLARIERTSARQPNAMSTLMGLYQSQGRVENANQTALAILRRTTSPFAATQNSSQMNPRYSRNNVSAERTAALAQLASSGMLKKMIDELKGKLAKSPDSIYTLEQLIEYSKAANQNEQSDEYLTKAIALRPDSHILRWNLANNLMARNKSNEACDQFLILLDVQPNWIVEQLYEISNAFSQAKRQKELIAKCQTIEMKQLRNPWGLINLIENSIREEPGTADSFLPIIEKIFDGNPNYRSYIVRNFLDQPELTRNKKFFELVKRSILPQSEAIASSSPWLGIDDITGYNQDGVITTVFSSVLDIVKSTPSLAEDLKTSIDQQSQRFPKWRAGPAMLALIDMTSPGPTSEKGRNALEAMLQDNDSWKKIPNDACWFLGQKLSAFEQSTDLAIGLLKNAESSNTLGRRELQFSPLVTLAKIAAKRPEEREDIKKRIDQRLKDQKNNRQSYGNDQYEAYQRINQAMSTSDLFISLNYPMDAYLAVRSLENDPGLPLAGQYWGSPEQLKLQLREKTRAAKNAMSDRAILESIDRLLPEKQRLDLMVTYPSLTGPSDQKIESGLLDVLRLITSDPASMHIVSDRLKLLAEQQPNDLSVNIVRALWMMEQDCQGEALAPELSRLLELAELEPIAPGRRANNRQRQEAKVVSELWILAREILSDPTPTNAESATTTRSRPYASHAACRQLALQLADIAMEGSLRQLAGPEQIMPLLELADMHRQRNDWEQADKSWERLLRLATAKTGRSSNVPQPPAQMQPPGQTQPAEHTQPSKPNLEPPLTISQFRFVMRVYTLAASSGRTEIARKALAMSLRGGLPVPDPDNDENNSQFSGFGMGSQGAAVDPIETEVQDLLQKAFAAWKGSSDTPAELYEALHLITLPDNRPDQIRLYINASAVQSGREESLASSLVRSAAKAGKLDELKRDVEVRDTKANSILAKKTLLALIAIESEDMTAAKTQLEELSQLSEKFVNESALPSMGLAALRAFAEPELKQASVPIMTRLVKNSLTRDRESDDGYSSDLREQPPMTDFAMGFNRYLLSIGDSKSVQENFETALQARSRLYQRYGGGDYVRVIQRMDLGKLAENAVQLDLTDYSRELLGRLADIPEPTENFYSDEANGANFPTEYLIRWYRTRPAEERYQAWLDWTMPNAERSMVRAIICNAAPPLEIPSMFLQHTHRGKLIGEQKLKSRVISNLAELVSAASQCNQLDALKQRVEALDAKSDPAVKILLDLISIHRKNDEEVAKCVSARIEQFQEFKDKRSPNNSSNLLLKKGLENALISWACSEFGYDREVKQFRNISNAPTPPKADLVRDDTHWLYDDQEIPSERSPDMYAEYDFVTSTMYGTRNLWWPYPLLGDFSISWDCPTGDSIFEYEGVRINTQTGSLFDSSGLRTSVPLVRTLSNNPRAEIQVAGNQVTFKIDGQPITTESTWGTSPWLALCGRGSGNQWRNLRIDGNPSIPSEVPLIASNTMDGWSSRGFREEQNRPRLNAVRSKIDEKNRMESARYDRKPDAKPIAWTVEQGQIRGKSLPKNEPSPKESWLVYQRPLASGETFRYEFFSSADRLVAHPTIGDVAIILKPEGLQLHYVPVNGASRTLYDLDSETMVPVESSQLKVGKLPIQNEAWNQVSLTHREKQIDLTVNGTLVYSLPLESKALKRFGIFRYQHQESLIRNAFLTGSWPKNISDEFIAEANAKNPSYRNKVPTDPSFFSYADTLFPCDWEKAATTGDQESLRTLLDMVLPGNATYPRLSFTLTSDLKPERASMKMDCVAVELARCAHRNNMSGEVLQAIDSFQEKNPPAKHALDALRCLLALESPDEKLARAKMQELIETMSSGDDDLFNNIHPMANYIVAKRASVVPGLRDLALAMTEKLHKTAIAKRDKRQDDSLMTLTNSLYGDVKFAIESDSYIQTTSSGQQWTPISFSARRDSSAAWQPSSWHARSGKAIHYGANQRSLLIFQSPLVGNFEVVAERTTWDRQEMAMLYAMHAAEPKFDLSAVLITNSRTQTERGTPLEIPGFRDKGRARFRIAVTEEQITTYTNDVQIHEQSITNGSFPWLLLRPAYPEFYGEVEDLRIIGSPTIPDELDLTHPSGYEGWDGSLSNNYIARDGDRNNYGNWIFKNDRLTGSFNGTPFAESYIRYLRPMLEDGVVEYESKFEDDSEVHPAIGSFAFLLRPEGIQIHRITVKADDVPALLQNNTTPLDPPSKPLRLKKKELNKVRLELKGDDVSITINDDLVATVRITDPPHQRHIGLLLLDGKSCEVRNMKYRGQWPKTLPNLSEQLLAKP